MNVLDLRPWPQRVWTRFWERPGATRDLADQPRPVRALTGLVDRLVASRVARRPVPPEGLQVVAVGNLAVGGTGKTPVVAELALDLAARGRRGCVLTRGYGSPAAGPLSVAAGDGRAGDEARYLARRLEATDWFVLQARDRVRGLSAAAARLPRGAVVILEDGHQTAAGRHLDILIVDRWRTGGTADDTLVPATGPTLPWGPWRESARGAARAGIVLVESDRPPSATAAGQPVTGFCRSLELGATPDDAGWAAVSGVARPERLEEQVARRLGMPPVLVVRCRDHAAYGPELRGKIFTALRNSGAPLAVTTEKDWIKLAEYWPEDLPVAVARQRLAWTGVQALPDLVGERLGWDREGGSTRSRSRT